MVDSSDNIKSDSEAEAAEKVVESAAVEKPVSDDQKSASDPQAVAKVDGSDLGLVQESKKKASKKYVPRGNVKRPQAGLRTKDIVALLSVIVSLMLVIGCIFYIDKKAESTNFIERQKPSSANLAPMNVPDLEQAPALPLKEDIETWDKNAEWVINNPEELANQFNGFSGMSFAWLRKQLEEDAKNPPNPQYFDIKDVVIDGLSFGTATVLEGTLVNAKTAEVEGIEPWQWITIEAENQQFLLVLAPASLDQFTIGNKVTVVGRGMGLIKSPGTSNDWVPLIGARSLAERGSTIAPSIVKREIAPKLGHVDEAELFADINDERTILELRPYFYLIGKINQIDSYDENIYEDALSANNLSGKMHDDPSAYRGHAFTVEGRVLDVFEDTSVTREKPYNISSVTRIIMWALIREPYKVKDTITGKETERVETVRHTYELAVVGDVPPLAIGQMIRCKGRFLKVHGIPLDKSSNRDAVFGKLQSKNFYSKFFVVPKIEIIEDEKDSLWVKAALTIVMCSFFLCVLWLYFKDVRSSEEYRTRSRHRHHKHSNGEDSQADAGTSADVLAEASTDDRAPKDVDKRSLDS